MNISSFKTEFKDKSKKYRSEKFRILKIEGPVSDFAFSAHIKQLTLGGLWQRKRPTSFLISLSLLSLVHNVTQSRTYIMSLILFLQLVFVHILKTATNMLHAKNPVMLE